MLVHQIWLQGWKHAPSRVRLRVGTNSGKWGANSKVHLWDDVSIVQLIEMQYPEHLEWYLGLQRVISKCDAARAFVLHAFGGIYADCDFDPDPDTIGSFLKLGSQRVAFVGSPWYGANNFLIASPQYAPFWTEVYLPWMKFSLESPSLWDIAVSIGWSTWPVMASSGPVGIARMLARRPDLAFALPPSTEADYGFHGTRDTDVNSSWYRFRTHRIQQLLVLVLVTLAAAGILHLAKEVVRSSGR
jgi:mannosyltransferase OCH1-like enzyme